MINIILFSYIILSCIIYMIMHIDKDWKKDFDDDGTTNIINYEFIVVICTVISPISIIYIIKDYFMGYIYIPILLWLIKRKVNKILEKEGIDKRL